MVEVPEHLLKRSKAARGKATGGGDGGDSGESDAGADAPAGAAAPAKAEAAQPVKAAAVPEPAPVPDPPEVTAYKQRPKVPIWVVPVLVALPVWAVLYAAIFSDPTAEVAAGPLAVGAEVFTQCAACHGATGGGGVGPQLSDGEVLLTFPSIEDQVAFVTAGSVNGEAYGDPGRPGGQRVGSGGMPAWGASLSEEEIFAAVCHERVTLAGGNEPSCTADAGAGVAAGDG